MRQRSYPVATPRSGGGPTYTYYVGGAPGSALGSTYQQAIQRANRANQRRYRQILQGYSGLRGRVLGDLSGVGQQTAADVNERYRGLSDTAYAQLVGRGLGNSTAAVTARLGVERERNAEQRRLQEGLATMRANADMAITQGRLGVMERRTDAGPDLAQMLALSQGLGQYGQRQGGYGGGGYGNQLQAIQQQAMMNQLGMAMQPFLNQRRMVGSDIAANRRVMANRLRRLGR